MKEGQWGAGLRAIVLVRHGEAVSKWEDPERPLTPRGRAETERMARILARVGLAIEEVRHSPKRRARETAAILSRAFDPPLPTVAVDGLGPEDPVEPVARQLEREKATVALVGHLPHLARLASRLVCGTAEAEVALLATSGVALLVATESGWSLAALLRPDMT